MSLKRAKDAKNRIQAHIYSSRYDFKIGSNTVTSSIMHIMLSGIRSISIQVILGVVNIHLSY